MLAIQQPLDYLKVWLAKARGKLESNNHPIFQTINQSYRLLYYQTIQFGDQTRRVVVPAHFI